MPWPIGDWLTVKMNNNESGAPHVLGFQNQVDKSREHPLGLLGRVHHPLDIDSATPIVWARKICHHCHRYFGIR